MKRDDHQQFALQNAYLTHQNQQAYLVYCHQVMMCLRALLWLQVLNELEKQAHLKQKNASGSEKLTPEPCQQNSQLKSLKQQGKPEIKNKVALDATYDSNTGRFLREDPFDGDVNTPPSLHRYLYAGVNPTVYVDPTGKCFGTTFDMMSPGECSRIIESDNDPELAKQIAFEQRIEAATLRGIGQSGFDAVKGTFELLGQLSSTLGEGLTFGNYYQGSARKFNSTLTSFGNAVTSPVETIKTVHTNHVNRVETFERAGDHEAVAQERAKYITNWVSGVFGTAKSITLIRNNKAKTVTESSDNKVELEVAETRMSTFEVPFRPLTPKNKREINLKIKSRTATKEEVLRLNWDRRFNNRRRRAVNRYWSLERKKLLNGGPGTRNWSAEQYNQIINYNKTKRAPTFDGIPIEGHHRYNAIDHPQLADDPLYIYPATDQEHFNRWHGGDYRNDTFGEPLNPNFPEEF